MTSRARPGWPQFRRSGAARLPNRLPPLPLLMSWRLLRGWLQHGTAYGSIWQQIWTTMLEAPQGFTYGGDRGVVFGILRGQVRFLSDVLGPARG